MLIVKKIFISVLLGYLTISDVVAQDINNYTIYTTLGAEVSLYFHDKITFCDYGDKASYSQYIKKQNDDKSVSIVAKVRNAQPADLKVVEGKRNHTFVLVYKEELSKDELIHDWEDPKKLKLDAEVSAKKSSGKLTIDAEKSTANTVQKTPSIDTATSTSSIVTSDDFVSLYQKGEEQLKLKNYEGAKRYYDKASEKNPNNQRVKAILKDIDNLLFLKKQDDDRTRKDEEFKDLVKKADDNYKNGNYSVAQEDYLRARELRPGDIYVRTDLEKVQQKIKEIDLQKKIKYLDENYNENIKLGDLAFSQGKFEEARAAFDIALAAKPNEKYPKDKLLEIDAKKRKEEDDRKRLAIERQFSEEISLGNEAYNAGNRDVARAHYLAAIRIKKDLFAEDQINKIDSYKRDSIQVVKNAELALARDRENMISYSSFRDKGDKAFDGKNYELANKYYKQALNYREEQYVKDRLEEVENRLNLVKAENERKRQFSSLVIKARAAFNNNDNTKAQEYYNQAHELFPLDEEVAGRLAALDKKMEAIRLEKERNDKYDTAISKASIAYASGSYNIALSYFEEAKNLKLAEPYPAKMILKINSILIEIDARKKREEALIGKNEIRNMMSLAYKATQEKRFDSAIVLYQKLLASNPEKADADFANKALGNISVEEQRIASRKPTKQETVIAPAKSRREARQRKIEADRKKILDEAWKKNQRPITQPEIYIYTDTQPNVQKNAALVNHNEANFFQTQAIPYSRVELEAKYPNYNFDAAPPDQTSDETDRKNRPSNFEISNKLLSDSSSLNLSDSTNYIKAVCKSISFNGTNAYIKLSIRNNSLADFLAGAMQLKVVKKDNSTINLNQRFISDFPIILPQKEFSLVYAVSAAVNVEPGDKLIMELNDRTRKIKLRINIPPNIYNMYKTAKL